MKSKRTLGDRINRGFAGLIILLLSIIIIRFAVNVATTDIEDIKSYPETMDEFLETSNSLDVPIELIDSTVNDAFVDGFFNE